MYTAEKIPVSLCPQMQNKLLVADTKTNVLNTSKTRYTNKSLEISKTKMCTTKFKRTSLQNLLRLTMKFNCKDKKVGMVSQGTVYFCHTPVPEDSPWFCNKILLWKFERSVKLNRFSNLYTADLGWTGFYNNVGLRK